MKPNVIFINTPKLALSVYEMGLSLWRILQTSTEFNYLYIEPQNYLHLIGAVRAYGAKLILNNHLSISQEWMTPQVIQQIRSEGIRQCAFVSHGMAFAHQGFDAYMVPDPTFPNRGNVWAVGRPQPVGKVTFPIRGVHPIIGSAGMLLPHKRFDLLVAKIISEFDHANIRLAIARAEIAPYPLDDANKCRALVAKCGKDIKLTIDERSLPLPELVTWLAQNDLNVFLYTEGGNSPAPAMSMDSALAARRPIAVSRASGGWKLFHGLKPSVCVEDNSLAEIIANGTAPLAPLYERFTDSRVLADIEACLTTP